ncbi:MAG: ATP-binding cassette domain-containing protein [Shewanellaceae bacterium]|nr:ATP-binding cassette domain-containing protein [Shewanellaceae bacterium]
MLAICAQPVQWRQGQQWRLAPMDLKLQAGQIVTLVGSNGAGKTTLLEALGPLCRGQGDVHYFGRPRTQWCRQQLARQVTYMPTRSPLRFPLRVADIVQLGTLPLVGHPAVKQRWTQQQLIWHQLEPWHDRDYNSLSTGEQQRVQLARVLLQLQQAADQGLLFLDEPTAHLDPQQQHQFWGLLQQHVQDTGLTVVLSCHDLNLAIQYSDQLIGLAQQRLLAMGTPTALINQTFIKQLYGCEADIGLHPRTGQRQVFTHWCAPASDTASPTRNCPTVVG